MIEEPVNESWEAKPVLTVAWSCTLIEHFFEDAMWQGNLSEFMEIYECEFFALLEDFVLNHDKEDHFNRKFIKSIKKKVKKFVIENELDDLLAVEGPILTLFKLQVLK